MVLITGSSGHLGNVLARQLIERGVAVRLLVRTRDNRSLQGLKAEIAVGDVCNSPSLKAAFAGVSRVFHCAAHISTMNGHRTVLHAVNVEGTRNIVTAALAAGVERFVYVSSVEALDMNRPHRAIEPESFDGSHVTMEYGRTKAEATRIVLEAARREELPAVIGVPSGIIGPFDFGSSLTGEMIRRYVHGRLSGYVDGGFDFVDVRDVAHGLIQAAERGSVGRAYFLTGHRVSFEQVLETLQNVSGIARPRLKSPYWLAFGFAGVASYVAELFGGRPLYTPNSLRILRTLASFDIGDSVRDLGYSARPLTDTLRDTVEWIRTQRSTVGASARG